MFEDLQKHYEYVYSLHSPHSKIIRYVPSDTVVLDVGCNWGYMAKELRKKGCKIFGIEIDKVAAEKAKQFCEEVIIGDIENIEALPFRGGYFDVLIFSDVLEHLKRPDLILKNLIRYLKPDGTVIASIPNIARLEYRIRHLLGRFDYEPYGGILSCTHYRFFTLKTAKELFKETGLEIRQVDYTGIASKIKIFPRMLAFQFLIIASPKKMIF